MAAHPGDSAEDELDDANDGCNDSVDRANQYRYQNALSYVRVCRPRTSVIGLHESPRFRLAMMRGNLFSFEVWIVIREIRGGEGMDARSDDRLCYVWSQAWLRTSCFIFPCTEAKLCAPRELEYMLTSCLMSPMVHRCD